MDRLHTLDAEFLHLEDDIGHLHIAGISIFEGPAATEAELTALFEAKLHLIPRYRQRVRSVPFELGRPVWVDDPHFNLAYHLRHTALPAPGDDEALRRLMGRLMSQALDPNRPLWEVWLVEGLPDGRWAIIFKVHHCMVDGIAGVGLLTALLDVDPDTGLPDPVPWTPEPEPSGPALVINAWSGLAGDAIDRLGELPSALLHPTETARAISSGVAGLVGFGRHLGTTPQLDIEGSIGPHRIWAHSSVTLQDVKDVGRAFDATVNDVVLAAVTNGYRNLLEAHRDDPVGAVVRSLVPVSVRHANGRGVPDNRVSAMLIELPVHLHDAVERLQTIHGQMTDLKASHMAESGEWLISIGDLAPPMVVGPMSRLAIWIMRQVPQRSVTTVTTNVPGPQFPLYCLGRRMVEYHPFVPITHGVRVGTAILSYDGRVSFGITGDYDTVPDVAVLADGIVEGIEQLLAAKSSGDPAMASGTDG